MDSIQPTPSLPVVPTKTTAAPAANPTISDSFSRTSADDVNLMKPMSFRTENDLAAVPRPMNNQEKSMFKSWFPNLDVDKAVVTAEATPQYNCISWTTGNTKSWDWPPSMYPSMDARDAFKHYYSTRGFSQVSADEAASIGKDKELVAYWEDPNGPTHGSVAGPSHGDRWESKCGQAARIQHGRDELNSDVYGEIKGYWLKTGPSTVQTRELSSDVLGQIRDKVSVRLKNVKPELQSKFADAYSQWQADRQSPQVAASSDPAAYCAGEGYQKLVKLGPEALPLLIDKMAQGDHFCQYAVASVTSQRGHHTMGSAPALGAKRVDCSEQEKSQQVMAQWLESKW